MCLDLNKDAIKQIASEDIVCYKRLLYDLNYDDININFIKYNKCRFTGIIKEIKCDGSINIENGNVYFCTNESSLNGADCSDKLGYKYSWCFDREVKCINIDGIDILIEFYNTNHTFVTPYRLVEVKIGETYNSELICEENIINSPVINIGLHTYANYKDAANDGYGIIIKCIIPKGSEYYEGTFGPYGSYASNQLKYLEIIKK